MAPGDDKTINLGTTPATVFEIEKSKDADYQLEYVVTEEGGKQKVDYSGAVAKTDPEEIRLVRKLDRWIMPTLWGMYWLNYLGMSILRYLNNGMGG